MGKKKRRGIKFQVALAMTICSTIICAGICLVSLNQIEKNLIEQNRTSTLEIAKIASNNINGDVLGMIQPGNEGMDNYKSVLKVLLTFKESDNVGYIYTMRKVDGQLQFVVDGDAEDPAAIGEPYETYDTIETAFSGEAVVDSEKTKDEWGEYYSAFAPIYKSNGDIVGIVGVDCKVESIGIVINKFKNMLFILVLVGIALSILMGFGVSGFITKNIGIIDNKIRELANSEGDLTQQIEIRSHDEIGSISDNMNQFLEYLRSILLRILESEEKLKDISGKINDSMDSSNRGLAQMTESMNQMRSEVEGMNVDVADITEKARNGQALTDDVMEETTRRMEHTKEIANNASKLSKDAVAAKNNISRIVGDMNDVIKEQLEDAKQVEQIEQLTAGIVEISSQTNLLALNASIEAARAGEAGKGFAVVADEISKLAAQSSETASQIGDVNQVIKRVVSALSKSAENLLEIVNSQIMDDYETLVNVGDKYNSDALMFVEQMNQINGYMSELQESMSHILASASEISESSIKEVENVNSSIDQISEINNYFDQVSGAINENGEVVEDLQGIINLFKI